MGERLKRHWNASPTGEGPITVTVYEEDGLKAKVRGLVQPIRTVDVPSAVVTNLYEPVPLSLSSNERVEVHQEGELIISG